MNHDVLRMGQSLLFVAECFRQPEGYGSRMRLPLLLFALTLIGAFVCACGSEQKDGPASASSSSAAAALPDPKGEEGDNDSDSVKGGGYYDLDDADFRAYGAAADAAETSAVSRLVTRYYAAALADDGAQACGLLDSRLAKSVPQEYREAPPVLRGKTCAVIASKFFAQVHQQLNVDDTTLKVGPVRVSGDRGYALLGFEGRLPERYMVIRREGGSWRIGSLLDIGLP